MARQTIAIEVGKTYSISFDITNYVLGTIRVMLGHPDTGVDGNNIDYNANQHVSFNQAFTSASTLPLITFYSWSTGSVMHIDNVSVREVVPIAEINVDSDVITVDDNIITVDN
jgi:hypothetical protein